jgi:hypothetical protein
MKYLIDMLLYGVMTPAKADHDGLHFWTDCFWGGVISVSIMPLTCKLVPVLPLIFEVVALGVEKV